MISSTHGITRSARTQHFAMSLVTISPGPSVPQAEAGRVDLPAFRRELEAGFTGEIRFDKVSRALYSTDASVYQIEPLAVVVPKSRADVIHAVKVCHKFRCPLTMGEAARRKPVRPSALESRSIHRST